VRSLVGEDARRAQDARVIAFGKDDAGWILLRARDQATHHLPFRPEPRLQLGAVLFHVDDAARDARRHGRHATAGATHSSTRGSNGLGSVSGPNCSLSIHSAA